MSEEPKDQYKFNVDTPDDVQEETVDNTIKIVELKYKAMMKDFDGITKDMSARNISRGLKAAVNYGLYEDNPKFVHDIERVFAFLMVEILNARLLLMADKVRNKKEEVKEDDKE